MLKFIIARFFVSEQVNNVIKSTKRTARIFGQPTAA